MVKDITAEEFLKRRAAGEDLALLDVREDWELGVAPVPAALVHIRMGEIAERIAELDPARETVVICRSGARSMEVARFLERQGFNSVFNLAGGILAWSRDLDPGIPQY